MLRVLIVGLGPIGIGCARAVADDERMKLVGLVDSDPAKHGRTLDDLDEHADSGDEGSLRISASLDQALASEAADAAIVATASRFPRVVPTLAELLERRVAAVSSCEEMTWPSYQHADQARQLDDQARRAGKALLGTGVNPGLVMDSLAVVASSAVRRVTSVRCVRRVDAALRRVPLQAKIGATLSVEQFQQRAAGSCKLGHAGLAESVALLAAGLGRDVAPGSVRVGLEPVVARQAVNSGLGLVEPGRVAGIHNTAHWCDGQLTIELDLTMAVGLPDPKDVIEINGPVAVKLKIPGGLPGDSATVAMLVNYAAILPQLRPGLSTMLDVPPAGCRGRDR